MEINICYNTDVTQVFRLFGNLKNNSGRMRFTVVEITFVKPVKKLVRVNHIEIIRIFFFQKFAIGFKTE